MFQLQQMFAQEPRLHMCVYVREGGCEVCAQVSLCVEEVVGMHSGCMWKVASVCPESPPGGRASLPGFYCAMYWWLPVWDLIQLTTTRWRRQHHSMLQVRTRQLN